MKAALYLRVSTEEQTVENQRAPLLELAARREWEPVLYEETGSAVKARPVFEQLLQDARRRKVRVVAVVALDRLGRSMSGVIATVKELDELGCRVVSLREEWLDTTGPTRELLIAVFSWVAQQEREILRERTSAGIQRARLRGTKSGKPIGRPRASQLLLGAAARRVQEGQSLRQAAKETGVSAATLTRYLTALASPRNDKGPGEAPATTPEPSVRQKPLPGGSTGRHGDSTS